MQIRKNLGIFFAIAVLSLSLGISSAFCSIPQKQTTTTKTTKTTKMVSLHGNVSLRVAASRGIAGGIHSVSERPPDPNKMLTAEQLEEKAQMLMDWWNDKKSVFCITGAGLSTESGIPDYRGHDGSYHRGHKPVIHQQYMESEYQRKRYWGRSMIGWSKFDSAKPNKGHFALADLERIGRLGVTLDDRPSFYEPEEEEQYYFGTGQRQFTILTQNVDSLHEQAGSNAVLHLHGRGNIVRCMNCGKRQGRNEFTAELKAINQQWLEDAQRGYVQSSDLRPDGDAVIRDVDYGHVHVPNCQHCGEGFIKTDVVFFGDTVPKERVHMCQEAVNVADGILVVGSSLAVHSAYRHVRAASKKGIPIAILNVGETRAEVEGIDGILKIEAPAGSTLEMCAKKFTEELDLSSAFSM